MGQGYFDDGKIAIELGEHVFATPGAVRRNASLTPHGEPAALFDSGGGVMGVHVTGQRLRANLGDAERYAYERLRALACSAPGTVAFEDNFAKRATFGESVCVDGLAEVRAYRFVDLSLQFGSPEKSSEPWPSFPAPDAPDVYAGTGTLLDYAAGGVALGHHAEGMRIDMQRDYPLREIPRARGARARGPARGAAIRFIVRSYAAVSAQNLARYLEDLEREIGPRPVDLTGNGNTFAGVVLEDMRPVHTDRRHTAFEATFAMEVNCAEWTTTEAPLPTTTTHPVEPPETTPPAETTTSTTGTTTTLTAVTSTTGEVASTTTAEAGTTTTAEPGTTTTAPGGTTTPPATTSTPPATTTALPGTTTTEGGCEPPLKADYRVLFCQMTGDFAPLNGVHWLDWENGCRWEQTYGGLDLALEWDAANGRWEISYALNPNCRFVAWGPDTPCDPTGQYELQECEDGGCFDGNTCEESGAESAIWVFGPDDGDELDGCLCGGLCNYCCSELYVDLPAYPCPPPPGKKCSAGTARFELMEEVCVWEPVPGTIPSGWTLNAIHCVGEGVWTFTAYCGTCGCLNCVYELAAHTPACPEGAFDLVSGPACCADYVGDSLTVYADTCGPTGAYCQNMCDECYEAWWPGWCGSEAGWIRWSNGRSECFWLNTEAPDGLTVSKIDCTYDEANNQAYWYFTVHGDGIDCTFKFPMARNCSDCPDGRYENAEMGECCGMWLDVYRCGQAPGPQETTTSTTSTTTLPKTTTTTEPGSTTTEEPDCDDCEPPVLEAYCVTFAGLGGDFAAGNGTWQATRQHPDCYWLYQDEDVAVEVARTGVNRYNVGLTVGPYGGGCSKIWAGPDDNWPCEPAGVYSELDCNDAGCADGGSCEKSVGATCVVAPCATTTTKAGTTTSTTTLPGTTTTTEEATTTTEAPPVPACPSSSYCTGTCAATYSCAGFAGMKCGHAVACSGTTMKWTRSSDCIWPMSQAAGSCTSGNLTCLAGAWKFTVTHGPTGKTCIYQKTAYAQSCPGGTYSKTGGTCSDCPSEVTLYV